MANDGWVDVEDDGWVDSALPKRALTAQEIDPNYRKKMADFIRRESAPSTMQQDIRLLPMGNRIADATMGVYNDPIHPERTVDALLGPEVKSKSIPVAVARGAVNFIKNPSRQIEGVVAAPYDLVKGAYNAATSSEPGSLGEFAKSTASGLVAPLGVSDIVKGNFDFPEMRDAWENNILGSSLIAYGAGKGVTSIKRPTMPALKADKTISKYYQQAVRPSVSGTAGSLKQLDKSNNNAVRAVYDIVKAKDEGVLRLGDELAGEAPINKLPESLYEHVQAVNQSKVNAFAKYDQMKREAGEAGAVNNLLPLADDLEAAGMDPVLNDLRPQSAAYLRKQAAIFRQRGEYTVDQTQSAIATLNKSIESYMRNPTPDMAGTMAVDASILKYLRKSLDDAITAETGPGYQALKNEYGRLTAIEKEAAHRARVTGRAAPVSLIDAMGGYLGSGEIVSGLLTLNPAQLAKGGVMLAIKQLVKKLNSPDYRVEKMYKVADKSYIRKPIAEGPESIPIPPKPPMTYDPSTGRNVSAEAMAQNNGPRKPLNLPQGDNTLQFDPTVGAITTTDPLGIRRK